MRKVARVRLTNGKEVNSYIQVKVTICKSTLSYLFVAVVKDLPGVRYHIVRGTLIPQEWEDVHNADPSMALRDRKQALHLPQRVKNKNPFL